ncbi:reverse transcriptase [Gossypium australe]|uniref:Reverse transcriptase n=1 Tax=Gossypium australe TaxID=47621 RepID=A0A5B6W7J0_9ROSI|nr:reverse transcriptase [Gossypium australe]
MDEDKIWAIVDWKLPTKVTKLWSFLGLTIYYRCFIKGYSKITAPLTNLLKKERLELSETSYDEGAHTCFAGLFKIILARWQLFLEKFDINIEYKQGRANIVVGTLSQKIELATISYPFIGVHLRRIFP